MPSFRLEPLWHSGKSRLLARTTLALLSMSALACAAPVFADAYSIQVSIGAGPLPFALQSLERQTGIELLFDHALVSELQSAPIHGNLTIEAALRELLIGTNLTVRRAQSGAWIIERPAAPVLAQPDAAVPEILIVGQRTQNADIRRVENDVQPYTIVTGEQMLSAHRDNLDQYFASRITSNTQVIPAGLSQDGNTLSEINLRGLGSQDTLVLVDGRRMPGIPSALSAAEFRQSDINAIPLHAIKRIEVLTGVAGGIYGFGALGGVVNVVLDRESRGVDLYVTEGLSSRGDGHRQGVEARFGHTSHDGATDFVVFAAHSQEDSILAGDREFEMRDRKETFDVAPQYYGLPFPDANSASIQSTFRLDLVNLTFVLHPDLTFKPEFGGATLSSYRTFLPVGFSGNTAALVTSLTQNAGQTDFSLTDRAAKVDLGSNPRSDALLANVRHRFGAGLEAFADAMVLRSRGESHFDPQRVTPDGRAILDPESPANPFTDQIEVDFPVESLLGERFEKHVESTRYTGGLVAELPFDWRGTAEIGWGAFRYSTSTSLDSPNGHTLFLHGNASDLDTNPLGDWDAFQRAVSGGALGTTLHYNLHTRFRDQSLRLAGPIFGTAAGPATVTLLAEHRTQDAPGFTTYQIREPAGTTTDTSVNSHASGTTSFYAELRSRLFDEVATTPFLRGLELQLAVRRDEEKDDFPKHWNNIDSERMRARFNGTTYTAGVKVSPTRWLMLRGSYATGEQPPPLDNLVESDPLALTAAIATDPKRGGTGLGADGSYLWQSGGDAELEATRASTVSLGTVLTPAGPDGPRLALDFSRIRRTRDVFGPSSATIMAHEDLWPDRVTRAALTEADRANGYTAGRVTLIDTRTSNGASLEVDAFDMHTNWPLRFLGGRLQFYSDATYHMHNVQKTPFQPDVNQAGYRDGPLKWRANAGFDWSRDRLTIGGNLQYFGRYLVISQARSIDPDLEVQIQGARSIPSQSYLDLHTTWRLALPRFGPVDDLTLDFGIVNVLDRAPPRESAYVFLAGPSYSRYGDPRQRRFEVGLSSHF